MSWIKLHRCIFEDEMWNKKAPFDMRSAWIDILLMACFKPTTLVINMKPVKLEAGQFFTSTRVLAERWHWSRGKVGRYLELLCGTGKITVDSTTDGTTITVVKYGFYQSQCDTDSTTDGAADRATDSTTDGAKNKNIRSKEVNNLKELSKESKKSRAFQPPTTEEVRTYCEERQNNIDPERFVDFYTAKGWMVGKNKMKDWKAAVRNWESRDRASPADPVEEMLMQMAKEHEDERS